MLRRQTVSHWRSCCALLLSAFTLCGAGEGKPDGHATELALTNSTPAFEAKGTLNQTNAPASTSSETNATPSEVDAKAAATDKVLADFIAGQKGQRDLTSTNTAAQAHAHSPAPLEAIPTDNLHEKPAAQVSTSELQLKQWQTELANARQFRTEQNFKQAISVLIPLLEGQAPDEIKRPALFELGLAAHQGKQLSKAQQIFSLYVSRYPEDPTVPEVLLRQGVIYRQMGVNTLALSKFYGVLSSALALKLDRFEHYQRVVLQAQTEIADSYFIEAQYR
ncbi:MAG: tetratricopeptide repeat protein, partial [Verrucomicrobiota bacterium]